MSDIFDGGICFLYHRFYQHLGDTGINSERIAAADENNFGGYSIQDLFVQPCYGSLKEELLSSKCIDIKQCKSIIEKAQSLLQTEKCKRMKCRSYDDSLHYGIREGEALRLEYLVALISFINFETFSVKCTSTFTPIKKDETIKSMKQRNSKFYYTCKNLRELVQYYGINNYPYDDDYETGPFYIVLPTIQNISSFAIRLNKPILTSKDIDTAKRKVTLYVEGMIIELNNEHYPACHERFFDCSWVSNNPKDKEYLFCGGEGTYKLEMQSIIITKTPNKYDEIINAYYKFDALLSGNTFRDIDITYKDVTIIRQSIGYILGDTSNKIIELDSYTRNNFGLFTRKKTQIVLHLSNMYDIKNKDFTSLIMHSLREQEGDDIGNNKDNVFRSILFKLFPNLQEIIIYSCAYYSTYAFNLLSLLSEFKSVWNLKSYDVLAFGYVREYEKKNNILIPKNIKQIIKQYHISEILKSFKYIVIKDSEKRWLAKVFSSGLVQKYKSENIDIKFQTRQGSTKDADWLTVSV
eukprot:425621_1